MNEIPERHSELMPDQKIIVLCKVGGRSAQVGNFLDENGFTDVTNLDGGILSWIDQCDSSLAKY